MIRVSVIVPIYNVEKQLDRCVQSLLNQKNYQNIQIILVNDGSKDNSGKIAKKYAAENPYQIIYLEKENSGLSDARNYGVKYATGEYISFVDSDDYVSENLYQDLEFWMDQKCDMIRFKICKVNEDGKIIEKNASPTFERKTGEEAFSVLSQVDVLTEVAWGYLYRRNFFISNHFQFASGKYHEDFGMIPLCLLKAKTVASVDVWGYHYVQTAKSITRGNQQTSYQRAMDLLYHYDEMLKTIQEYPLSLEAKKNIKTYYTNCIILETRNLSKNEQKNYIQEIKKRKLIKNIHPQNLKQWIKRVLLTVNIKLYLRLRKVSKTK